MSEVDDKHGDHTPDDIGCMDAIEALYAYIDGEIDDESSIEAVEKHMAHCRSCYSRTQVERALSARMRQEHRNKAPAELQSRLRKLMDDL